MQFLTLVLCFLQILFWIIEMLVLSLEIIYFY